MKKSFIILFVLFLSASSAFSETGITNGISLFKAGHGWNFNVFGDEETARFTDALFSHFPEKSRKGHIWKLRNVHVDGIDQKLTLQVHEGIVSPNNCGGYGFHTFSSEKHKQSCLSNKKEGQKNGLLIYVKHGNKHVLKTREDADLVMNYLKSICDL